MGDSRDKQQENGSSLEQPVEGGDLQLRVEQQGEQLVVTAVLDRSADTCYRLFSRVEDVPAWLWVVGRAVVQRRDDRGRALEVDFMGSLERASISYGLAYAYDDEAREVRWTRLRGAVRALSGSCRFFPLDPGHCQIRYALQAELSGALPPWSDGLYQVRPAEAVVLDFCEWVDRQCEDEKCPGQH